MGEGIRRGGRRDKKGREEGQIEEEEKGQKRKGRRKV